MAVYQLLNALDENYFNLKNLQISQAIYSDLVLDQKIQSKEESIGSLQRLKKHGRLFERQLSSSMYKIPNNSRYLYINRINFLILFFLFNVNISVCIVWWHFELL